MDGITFGASLEDVEAVYGEPKNIYEDDDYTSLTYKLAEDAEIDFKVCKDGGLLGVDLFIY